jgi:hypothetical protein
LAFVVALGIIKELVVEIMRWRADKAVNKIPCRRLTANGTVEDITLADVEVGDIL